MKIFLLSLCMFFISLTSLRAEESFRFAVIADPQVFAEPRETDLNEALQTLNQTRGFHQFNPKREFDLLIAKLNALNLDFVVIVGDLVDFVSPENLSLFKEQLSRLKPKAYLVPGDHEAMELIHENGLARLSDSLLTKEERDRVWQEALGQKEAWAQNFVRGNYYFGFLDTGHYDFVPSEIERIEEALNQNLQLRAILFSHLPLRLPNEKSLAEARFKRVYAKQAQTGRRLDLGEPSPMFDFLKTFGDRVELFFAGHIHLFSTDKTEPGFRQITLEPVFESGMFLLVECSKARPQCAFESQEARYKFYENGNLEMEQHFRNRKFHGRVMKYAEDGTILEERHFVRGVLHGPVKMYDFDGTLREEAMFKNGQKIT